MFSRQTDKSEDIQVIALVELDMQKMRMRFALARAAIRERMWKLDHPRAVAGKRQGIEDAPDNCGLDKTRQQHSS